MVLFTFWLQLEHNGAHTCPVFERSRSFHGIFLLMFSSRRTMPAGALPGKRHPLLRSRGATARDYVRLTSFSTRVMRKTSRSLISAGSTAFSPFGLRWPRGVRSGRLSSWMQVVTKCWRRWRDALSECEKGWVADEFDTSILVTSAGCRG